MQVQCAKRGTEGGRRPCGSEVPRANPSAVGEPLSGSLGSGAEIWAREQLHSLGGSLRVPGRSPWAWQRDIPGLCCEEQASPAPCPSRSEEAAVPHPRSRTLPPAFVRKPPNQRTGVLGPRGGDPVQVEPCFLLTGYSGALLVLPDLQGLSLFSSCPFSSGSS